MKTKLSKLLFLFTIICFQVNAQDLTEAEIIGTWKVIKIGFMDNNPFPKDQKAKLESIKKAFLKSKFYFKEDKHFSFDIAFEDMEIKKGHWKINKSTKAFVIQEWKDKDTNKSLLMEITAKREGDKIFFLLSETFIALEMFRE